MRMVNWKTLISILFINLSEADETIWGYHIAIEVTNEVNAKQKIKIVSSNFRIFYASLRLL
jgi:hypothetical protein